jgi:hypothetical protein
MYAEIVVKVGHLHPALMPIRRQGTPKRTCGIILPMSANSMALTNRNGMPCRPCRDPRHSTRLTFASGHSDRVGLGMVRYAAKSGSKAVI